METVEQEKEIETNVAQIVLRAKSYIVSSDETLQSTADVLKIIKGLRGEINETFDPIVEAAYKAHKAACSGKKKHTDPLDEAERTLKFKSSNYIQQREQKRLAEQAAIEAIARAEAEAARKAEAAALRKAGEKQEAKAVMAAPLIVNAPVIAPAAKTEGLSYRTVWKFRITDAAQVPEEFKLIDEAKIRKIVNAMADQTRIPGITVYSEKQVAVR